VELQWRRLQEMETGKGKRWMHLFSEGKRGRRRGGSMVSEADDASKSGAVVREAEGGGWRLEVEYDQRKSVGQMCGWVKLLIRPTKKIWLIV
jgi:hypothetical protein